MSKRIKALILALMVLLTFSVPSIATTNELATIDKTIDEHDVQSGLYDVTLSVTGSTVTAPKPVDVVLVIDASGSMTNKTSNGKSTRLEDAKNAAKAFVDIAFANNNANGNTIAIVKFDKSATIISNLSNVTTTVLNGINSISNTNSGTNIKDGFDKAKQILDSRESTRDAIVVLLSDGEANGYNQGGNISDSQAAQAAIAAGRALIGTARVYTIGLSVTGTTAPETLKQATRSAGGVSNGGYYSAPDSDNLKAIYQNIGNNINPAVLNAKVIDEVASNFEIVSIGTPVPDIGTVTTSALTIKWEIGDLGSTNVKLTYRIKLKENWSDASGIDSDDNDGKLDANVEAKLTYNTDVEQYFPVPGVKYYNLTTNTNPSDAGNIVVKLNDNVTSKRQFAEDVKVAVSQTAKSGYTFKNWTGDALDSAQSITMNANKTVIANYQQDTPQTVLTAANDAYSTTEGVPLVVPSPGILSNDTITGLTLNDIIITESITEGSGTLTHGSELGAFTYTPAAGFTGTAVFKYKLRSGEITSKEATVTITVNAKEIEPNASIDIESTIKSLPSGATASNGESITSYQMVVTNNGNQDLYDVEITNDGNGNSYLIGNLSAGASRTQTANSFTVSGEGTTKYLTATVVGYLTPDSTTPPAYAYVSEEGSNTVQQVPDEYERASVTDSDTTDVTIPSVYIPPYIPPYTPPETPVVENVTLTTSVSGQGSILPGPGASTYGKGTMVQLNPTPATGWQFSNWQGDTVNGSNQIYMDGNKSVTAVFTEIPVIIPVEPAAAAPAIEEPVSEPQIEEIAEEEAPAAPAELPKTGGVPAAVFYGLGGFIAVMGVALRSKTKKKE